MKPGPWATWAKRAGRPSGLGGGGGFCWVSFHNREMISPEGTGVRSPERAGLAKWSKPREWAAGPGAPTQLGGPRRRWGGGLAKGNGAVRLGQNGRRFGFRFK
jgi:hypothetical protein